LNQVGFGPPDKAWCLAHCRTAWARIWVIPMLQSGRRFAPRRTPPRAVWAGPLAPTWSAIFFVIFSFFVVFPFFFSLFSFSLFLFSLFFLFLLQHFLKCSDQIFLFKF
jgi:hypothetical protein